MPTIDKIAQYNRAVDYAKSRGGECLSTEYTKAKDKMLWKCDNPTHPQWESPFDSMVSGQRWCTLCGIEKNANKNRLSDGLERAYKHAQSKGGQCLSTEYTNARDPMLWKCDNPEHPVWQSDFDHVVSRDRWCQQCAYDKSIMPDGFKKAQAYAKKQNGQCLTPPDTLIKKHTYLLWKCDDETHPAWESLYHGIVELKTWCPRCAGKYTSEEYLEKAKLMAIEKGGQCLSAEYVDQRTPMLWTCDNPEHPSWSATYDAIANKNNWCKCCKEIEKQPIKDAYLNRAKEHAKSLGGECLSTEYKGTDGHLLWKCKDPTHPSWEAKYGNVVGTLQRWCPACAGHFDKDEGLRRAQEYAKSRGGECLSTEYTTASDKMLWNCKEALHQPWEAAYSNVVLAEGWCPECGTATYYKEHNVRVMLEMLLGFPLKKARPSWNINPQTNQALELDGYNEEKKFAFEFQGRHHFMDNIFTPGTLEKTQYKDKVKKENCENNNIFLLILNDHKNRKRNETILAYVIEQLQLHNIDFNTALSHQEIIKKVEEQGQLSYKQDFFKQAQEQAKNKNGVCLSEYYVNYETPLLWKCHNLEHDPWYAQLYTVVKMGTWCPECKGKVPKYKMFRKVHEYAQSQNGQCLSNEYIKKTEPMEWKCDSEEHESWLGSYEQIVERRKWCPQC
jgi:hypothetical protein